MECKVAQGANNKGELPKDFWEKYSAMANTHGGRVYLGIKEHKKTETFEAKGIEQIEQVKRDLVNTANNRKKVSVNLLSNTDIEEIEINGKTILEINIRRATRKERPVYLTEVPFGNTYRRRHEADQRLSDDDVKRMIADQQFDSLDTRILKGFDFNDLNQDSFKAFKQSCATRQPAANFAEMADMEFLKQIGGWRKSRETGESGLTVAGLLMFGTYSTIKEEFPHYFVDYQERPEATADRRYVERICPDYTWSGNLYDFYRKVYPKLVADIKVGFVVKDGVREEDPLSHVAVREALVNTMVHADYSLSNKILVVKRPDLLGFVNPGLMRIPFEVAMEGGESDSRNKTLQDMFRLIGAGDRQGFGVRKIIEGWKEYDWRVPQFQELDEPSPRVVVKLTMLSLFPEKAVQFLKVSYGKQWQQASELEKIAFILAYTEKALNHGRLSQFSSDHTRDISDCLKNMAAKGWLATTGAYRSKVYHLPNQSAPSPEDVFDFPNNEPSSLNNEPSSPDLDGLGRVVHAEFSYPFIANLETLDPELEVELEGLAQTAREKQRVNPEEMKEIILKLCRGQYVTVEVLSKLLNREMETLRGQYLTKLKNEGKIRMAFPRTPNDPRQAYITVE